MDDILKAIGEPLLQGAEILSKKGYLVFVIVGLCILGYYLVFMR
jgi:uncharacterized metal-binding protein